MDAYQQSLEEEQAYLKEVLAFIREELAARQDLLAGKKSDLAEARKEMWEDAVHYTADFEKLVDMMPQLNEVSVRAVDVDQNRKLVEGLRRLLDSPYFGRIDFKEADFDREQIYIGLRTLNDNRTHRILVYDWRAPVSSMFYRHEPGPATYESPAGEVSGELLLKRQYKITNSQLEYFFDCSLAINDEMLQEVLGHNASLRMRNIVETIQKEQDLIIRDTTHDLVIVQGVAGSGKTSIALHRIAYLLYHGLRTGLDPKNGKINAVYGIIYGAGRENMGKKYANLVEELRNNPRNVRFETLQSLLAHYVCVTRQPRGGSSHYIFTHPALPYCLTVPKDRPIKAIYVKKALQMIEDIKEVTSDERE